MFYKNQTEFSFQDASECLVNGTCAINPGLTSVQEILVLYLKEIGFYLLKLKDFGITNDGIRDSLIDILFGIVINVPYKDESFNNTIMKLSKYLEQSKALYEKFCLENDLKIEFVPTSFKHLKTYDLTSANIKGEKYFLKKMLYLTPEKKGLYNIIIFLCKTYILKIVELKRLGGNYDEGYYKVLSLVVGTVPNKFEIDDVKQQINDSLNCYYDLTEQVYEIREKLYGKPNLTEVSLSTKEGNAILVSGTDMKKLEHILKAVKGKNINIYTHGLEMVTAHCYPKMKANKELIGHYGSGLESCLVDFASFPGAILMTKGSLQTVDFLYRGRLFTLDPLASPGVKKIDETEFDKVVDAALESRGFKHATQKPSIKVGFDENELYKNIEGIFERLANKEIKHLYIVGLLNYFQKPEEYYEDFFKKLPKDCYAISLSYNVKGNNIYSIDSLYDYSLVHKILNYAREKYDLKKLNISVFLTRTDKQIIYNLLYLKYIGIKNVYMSKIPTALIIPTISDVLKDLFDIKEVTNAETDIKNTLNS